MSGLFKAYQLAEFKRRHKLGCLRKELQLSMQDKHKNMWWCMDTALQEMRAQFVESTNHCVIDDFLGPDAFAKVLADVIQAKSEGMLDVDGLLSFKGREETIRTDRLGWFDCSETPTGAGGGEIDLGSVKFRLVPICRCT